MIYFIENIKSSFPFYDFCSIDRINTQKNIDP